MKRWKCVECQSTDLTVRIDDSRLYLVCDKCEDTRWVKR